ncbi:MFS transporter [Paenibacillus allorhizoplanae]|uniref:MFS transporter n=1 Tax=Paenibacillus allorhizoplanae TaxID=2905648 RepID=UPI0030B885FB
MTYVPPTALLSIRTIQLTATYDEGGKSNDFIIKKKLAYSSNQIGLSILWQAFSAIAIFYYVTVLNVSGTSISIEMIIYGILNALFNLAAGYVSNRTKTRFGRRIPYILFGSLPFGVLFFFLFNPPSGSTTMLLIYFFTRSSSI